MIMFKTETLKTSNAMGALIKTMGLAMGLLAMTSSAFANEKKDDWQQDLGETLTTALHIVDAEKAFGPMGRWVVYAGSGDQNLAVNFVDTGLGWNRQLGHEESAELGDAQIGIGYRRDRMQMGFGYLHRSTKVENVRTDSGYLAFTFRLKLN